VRRGLPRRRRTRRWPWHVERRAGGERRSSASNGATAVTAAAAALASREGEGARRGQNGASGGAGWCPDRVKPVGRASASMTPAYDLHVAGAGWSEAGVSACGRGEGELGRVAERAEREAGRPSSACPLFLFFSFFSQFYLQIHFDYFKTFSSFTPKNKSCHK